MTPRPKRDRKAMPFPRGPSGKERDQFWLCYEDDLLRCRVANLSKSLFAKYFSEHIYKSFKDMLTSYDRFIQSICNQDEPKIPLDLIYEPERYPITVQGTVVERFTKKPVVGARLFSRIM